MRRKRAIVTAVVLVAVGFVAGWYARPAPEHVKVAEKVDARERETTQRTTTAAESFGVLRSIDTVRTEVEVVTIDRVITAPDGTVTRERESGVKVGEEKILDLLTAKGEATEGTTETKDRTLDLTATREVEITNDPPDWRLGALLGVDLAGPVPTTAYGFHVERRILGPVSAGVWGVFGRGAAGGLSASLEL